jgi:hypothetical protein
VSLRTARQRLIESEIFDGTNGSTSVQPRGANPLRGNLSNNTRGAVSGCGRQAKTTDLPGVLK